MVMYFQLGGFALLAPYSNFLGKGPVAVGSLQGVTPYGAFDMAGNAREWCSNETPKGRLIRGGAWGDNSYMYDNWSQAPAWDRSDKNGFRCVLYLEPEKVPGEAFQMVKFLGHPLVSASAEIGEQKPAADSIFQVYREQFSYDKTDLNARVESRKESPDWSLEKITLDTAYGRERLIAWLFLPRNAAPPYQTVIYMGGDAPVFQRSSQDIENYYEVPMFFSFLVKNGRAVLYPVYKGFFERGSDALIPVIEGDNSTHQWAEVFIQQVKDLRRSIDYLETRPDVDREKLAFCGMSMGAGEGPRLVALEPRIKACVLFYGGAYEREWLPEVDPFNFASRVRAPVLMVNGKYDVVFSPEGSQVPLFHALGTAEKDKQLILLETGHASMTREIVKESLAWFDRYLGPVHTQ